MKITAALAITTVLGLSACATISPQEIAAADFGPAPTNYEEVVKGFMAGILKDPYSAVYRFEKPRKGFAQDGWAVGNRKHYGYIVKVGVNAKNSFGAFAGETTYDLLISDGNVYDVTASINDPVFPRAKFLE